MSSRGTRHATARHLRALDGGDGTTSGAGLIRAAQRPGDRHDAWSVASLDDVLLKQIQEDARASSVPTRLAVSLVLQRLLAVDDLRVVFGDGTAQVVRQLDELAWAARVERAVSAAYAAYVRALTATRSPGHAVAATVPLPVRVIERIGYAPPSSCGASADVNAAVAWERAAALDGKTMAEWAAFSALRVAQPTAG